MFRVTSTWSRGAPTPGRSVQAAAGKLEKGTPDKLRKLLEDNMPKEPTQRLRLLWALNAIDDSLLFIDLIKLLKDKDEHMRGWVARLVVETSPNTRDVSDLVLNRMVPGEESAFVRKCFASAALRVDPVKHTTLGRDLVRAAYNHSDHMQERVKMMQAWADYLDGLVSGANVTSIRRRA